jgi:Fur family ferric uptake transcriptional regulator
MSLSKGGSGQIERISKVVVVQRRNTAQRAAIIEVLERTGEFSSAQDLHQALRAEGSTIGLATVYRAVQDMAAAGDLDTVRNASGEVLYRQCARPMHHHHLVCRRCGRTVEVEAPGVEQWARSVAQQHGYVDIDHQVELFGTCGDCAAKPSGTD